MCCVVPAAGESVNRWSPRESDWGSALSASQRAALRKNLQEVREAFGMDTSKEASSAATKLRVLSSLESVLVGLRELRGTPEFWQQLAPGLRVRYEDFQGDLAAMRSSWRE